MKKINDREYLTDEGKVFIHKETKDIMGWGICLGDNDSIDNYDEVDCPEEYKGNKDYDNTVKEEKKAPKFIDGTDDVIENYEEVIDENQ